MSVSSFLFVCLKKSKIHVLRVAITVNSETVTKYSMQQKEINGHYLGPLFFSLIHLCNCVEST